MEQLQTTPQQPQGAPKDPRLEYWANKSPKDVIDALQKQATNSWDALRARGVPTLWRIIYAQIHGVDPSNGATGQQLLQFVGPKANYVRFRIAITRTHIKQRNQLAKGNRPSFRAVAVNNNSANLAQVPIAGKALTYLFREAGGEAAFSEALESDGYFGEGFVWTRWDVDGGDEQQVMQQVPAVDPMTQQPIVDPTGQPLMKQEPTRVKTGSPSYTPLFPWYVLRDQYVRKSPWIRCTELVSKHVLMARYPQHAEALNSKTLQRRTEPGAEEMLLWDAGKTTTDDILLLHHFYHQNDSSCPDGRYIGYVDDLPLWDEKCPVSEGLPVESICSAKYLSTPLGYPEASDLIAQQEMLDELLSQWASNVLRFGNQNLWAEDGVEFDQAKFQQGGGFFTLKPNQKPPQVIDWNTVPDGTRYLIEYIPQRMSETSGMNSVVRGNPDSNISSGVFASLMESIAERFVSSTQEAYDFALTGTGNTTLRLIRANASAEFLVNVAGNSSMPYMRAFSAGDTNGVHSVYVERQSPVMNSIPGRFEVFEKTWKLPKDMRRAAALMLKTGDDEAYTFEDQSATILIEWENEQLIQGIPVTVSKTDDPKLHGPCHSASLDRLRSSPPPQEDMQAMQVWNAAIQAHVQHLAEHAVTWAQTDPVFAAMLGLPQPPIFDPMMGKFSPTPGTEMPTPKQGGPQPQAAKPAPGKPQQNPQLPANAGQPGQPGKPKTQEQPQ